MTDEQHAKYLEHVEHDDPDVRHHDRKILAKLDLTDPIQAQMRDIIERAHAGSEAYLRALDMCRTDDAVVELAARLDESEGRRHVIYWWKLRPLPALSWQECESLDEARAVFEAERRR